MHTVTVTGTGVDDGPAPLARPATMRDVAGGLEPGQASVTTSVTVVWELAY